MIEFLKKIKSWWLKQPISKKVRMLFAILIFIAISVYLPIFLLSVKTSLKTLLFIKKTFPDYANASSITGYGFGLMGIMVSFVAITIAFKIYNNQTTELNITVNDIKKFQTDKLDKTVKEIQEFQIKTLNEGINNLEHMAFSLKSLNIGDLPQKVRELIESRNPTHLLVISRYSAIPAFWLDVRAKNDKSIFMNEIIIPILQSSIEVKNMLFIGPDEATFKSYATKAKVDSDQTWGRYIDYMQGQNLTARHIPSKKVKSMGANAIILKYDEPNVYGSKYEVIFFGEPDDKDQEPEVFKTPKIYHAQVALMVRLWKYELKTIIADNLTDNQWLEDFYKHFYDEEYNNA